MEKIKLLAQNTTSNFPIECAKARILHKFVDSEKVYAHDPGCLSVAPLSGLHDDPLCPGPRTSRRDSARPRLARRVRQGHRLQSARLPVPQGRVSALP